MSQTRNLVRNTRLMDKSNFFVNSFFILKTRYIDIFRKIRYFLKRIFEKKLKKIKDYFSRADAELQMVFTKTTYEKDLDAALAAEYGVAILSIMINGDNASDEENWYTLFETAGNATFNATSDNQMSVATLILGDIIDPLTPAVSSEFDYYFYVGSYNFEPCYQNVFWIVAEPIASVTSDQVFFISIYTISKFLK